ncbi:MAG: polyhydroxyalkanoate depolymerase [Erythrobacter sp.]|nr:polyhydroxyalkanoate depolymerase [Erythrobacter sp.]
MLYHAYELQRSWMNSASALASISVGVLSNPANPFGYIGMGPMAANALDVFAHATAHYGKPAFGITEITIDGKAHAVSESTAIKRPFGDLLRFTVEGAPADRPRLLIVAPMSGHYATLLRGTVETLLPDHEVYVTDWIDARLVPLAAGSFDLDDYIDYVIAMLQKLGPDTHVMAVCQPSVPVLAAIARMEAEGDPSSPRSMTLMGGPIDTRRSPTAVNQLAMERGTDWFRRNCITRVPFPHLGAFREVYPGFLQLSGFMAMNFDKHLTAHYDMYKHLVAGDGDSAEKHRDFYDEYMAVMDLTAEFYLQTVDTVFVKHALPKGEMMHRGKPVDLKAIRGVALMTVEGENDDISGVGQTKAAHDLCVNIPDDMRVEYLQKGVGHYGVFNGSRFRSEIAPRIADFMLTLDMKAAKERRSATAETARKALKVAS